MRFVGHFNRPCGKEWVCARFTPRPMRIIVRRKGPAGYPQLFLLDPDRNIIELNGA